jgi:hypothetical protein
MLEKGNGMSEKISRISNIDYAAGVTGNVVCLQWTTTPPTVEGWYWVKHEAANEIIMTQVCKLTDDYLTTENGPLYVFTHWLGPLLLPEPPA